MSDLLHMLLDDTSVQINNHPIINLTEYNDEFTPIKENDSGGSQVYKLLDLDKHFIKCFTRDPTRVTILNELNVSDPDYKTLLDDRIFSKSNIVDYVPQCNCGKYVGFAYEHSICNVCNSPVEFNEIYNDKAFFSAWLKCPKKIPHGFLHPQVYSVLTESWLCQKRVKNQRPTNYLDYVLDPKLKCDIPELLPLLEQGRGLKYFYENFEQIMSFFVYIFPYTAKKYEQKIQIVYFLALNKDRLFTRYLPILPSTLHSIGSVGDDVTLYTNKNCKYVKSSIANLAELSSDIRQKRLETVENLVYKAYVSYMLYQDDVTTNQLSIKRALPRMHMIAARLNFTCHAVIVPHLGTQKIDELVLPWTQIVELLKPHLLGELLKHGYDFDEAIKKHFIALQKYDIDIDNIISKLIKDCPFKGLPCLFNRNPTIYSGSIQFVFIVGYETDPNIHTIGMPLASVYGYNADFDGDNMNIFLLCENEMAKQFITLHSAYLLLGRNKPEIGKLIRIPQQMLMTLNNYLQMFNKGEIEDEQRRKQL